MPLLIINDVSYPTVRFVVLNPQRRYRTGEWKSSPQESERAQ